LVEAVAKVLVKDARVQAKAKVSVGVSETSPKVT